MTFPFRWLHLLRILALCALAGLPETLPGQTGPDGTFGITTLTPPWIDVKPGPAYWARMRLWQGIPSIERAPGGRLWATWYTGGVGEGKGHNHALLVTSGDDGRTWSQPVAVYDPSRQLLGGQGGDPHVWLDPNGKLWWFVHRVMPSPGVHPRTCWGFYTDEPDRPNPRWQGPVFAGYGYSLNKEVVLSDGTWLHMIDPFSRRDDPASPLTRSGAHVYRFAGYDQPFEPVGHVKIQDTPFTEHMVVERRDGSLWMLARTRFGVAQAVSTDRGRSWTEGEAFTRDFSVNTRFSLQRLASGRLLFIGNDHPKHRRNLTAMLSEDDGRTWPHKLVLDERERVSYPDATQARDGSIYAVYDHGRYQPGEQAILFAKFTEADVMAGRLVTESSRLRQTINRLADEGGGVHHVGESADLTKRFQQMDAGAPALEEGERAELPRSRP
ncbi:MAG: exo-alpha-sialidase [Candidatus Didemnitutus sp.]|nr:exo-alpha-sialidase [Candidatus Didemnitutus sp.]